LQRNEHFDVFGNVAAKVQNQSPCMGNELRRPVHDLLQHRLSKRGIVGWAKGDDAKL